MVLFAANGTGRNIFFISAEFSYFIFKISIGPMNHVHVQEMCC